jgi:hypothetical protein
VAKSQLTARDMLLLRFVAEHRLVLAGHVQALLGISTAASYARLRGLTAAGYLRHENVFHRQPGCYQATRKGLAAIDSRYSTRQINLGEYQHDVGVAWLWLAARHGAFGPMGEVIAERRLRSHDATPGRTADPFGVRLGGYGPRGRERLHYPDLVLVTPDGKRIAVELELSGKGRTRREKILSGYAADARVDAVLYLVEHRNHGLARSIRESARRAGIDSIVHVQPFRWGESSGRHGTTRAAERPARRTAGRDSEAGRAARRAAGRDPTLQQ